MVVLQGSPEAVDEFFKPFIRGAEVVLGLIATAFFVWLLPIWTWPIPAVLVVLIGEWILARRGVQIYQVHLTPEHLKLLRGDTVPPVVLAYDAIQSVQVMYQNQGPHRSMTWWVMNTSTQRLAFQLECEPRPEWTPDDVPLDLMTALFGGNPGVLRALADPEDIIDQVLRDRHGTGLRWLREHIPRAAWQRPTIRVWNATTDEMDEKGLYASDSAQHIQCHHTWAASDPVRFDLSSIHPKTRQSPLPQLNLHFTNDRSISFPTPTMDTWWPMERVPAPRGHTTHLAEGVFVFWWFLRHTNAGQLPAPITEALADVHRLIMPLPDAVHHHISEANQTP